jgi:enoyl-CoA hydratase
MSEYETLLVETKGKVLLVSINRPESLNALNAQVMRELTNVAKSADANPEIAVLVIIGAGRAFAAGADIKEMQPQSFTSMYMGDYFADWDVFASCRKPKIAAVNGFALGGGCELAMMCDMIFASTKAKFGQPEIKLGVTPGMGGSVRLTKAVGKAMAMDLVLTGRMIDAEEAKQIGLVSRVIEHDELLTQSLEAAQMIAGYSQVSAIAAKEMVNQALELSTTEGVRFERRLFHALFATEDQKEGMAAFSEKRNPEFKDK